MSISQFQSPKLIATDLFACLHGPFGQCPVQFTGTLKSGEYVYFRADDRRIELEIYPSEADFEEPARMIGRYTKPVVIEEVVPQEYLDAASEDVGGEDEESVTDDPVIAEMDKNFPVTIETLGAGLMNVDTAADLVIELLGQYLKHKEQAAAQSALADEVELDIEPIS